MNQDRALTAADIDLVLRNQGNPNYDVDGDGQTTRSDSDYEVHTIFGTEYGDANLDGRINALDFNTLASNFGHTGGWAQGDFNGDGVINSLDFTTMASHFGFTAAVPDASLANVVPEPSAFALCAVMLLAWRRSRA